MRTRIISLSIIGILSVLTLGCQNDKNKTTSQKTELRLPKTPEAAIKVWEESVNNNEFDLPRRISKGEVLDLVNSVAASNKEEKIPISQLKILNIQCQKEADFAHCTCNLINDNVKQSFRYSLVNENNQWFLLSVDENDNATAARKSGTSTDPL